MDLPIELFLSFIGLSVVMGLVGLLVKTKDDMHMSILMFIAGAMITFWAIITDNIVMGEILTDSEVTILPDGTTYMNQQTSTGSIIMRNGSQIFVGEDVVNSNSALAGKKINQVQLSLSKTGSPTGNFLVGVWSSVTTPTTTNYLYLISTRDSASLTTTQTSYTFTGVNEYTLNPNEVIGVFYNLGSSGNEVRLFANATASTFDGTNSVRTQYVSSWTDFTLSDIRGMIALTGIEEFTINTYEDNLVPFTEYPKILFGIFGAIFMLAGAVIWKHEEN